MAKALLYRNNNFFICVFRFFSFYFAFHHLKNIDLVLTPLVAFDRWGNRLGMGGGFYDRTFASQLNLKNEFGNKRPFLCGVAHKCQQVRELMPKKWDFPLDWVAAS